MEARAFEMGFQTQSLIKWQEDSLLHHCESRNREITTHEKDVRRENPSMPAGEAGRRS